MPAPRGPHQAHPPRRRSRAPAPPPSRGRGARQDAATPAAGGREAVRARPARSSKPRSPGGLRTADARPAPRPRRAPRRARSAPPGRGGTAPSARSSRPWPGGGGGHDDRDVLADARGPPHASGLGLIGRDEVGLGQREDPRQGPGQARLVALRARPRSSRGCRRGRRRRAARLEQVDEQPHRSTWARKWWPRPRPSLAPSISPGMSARRAGARRSTACRAPGRAS